MLYLGKWNYWNATTPTLNHNNSDSTNNDNSNNPDGDGNDVHATLRTVAKAPFCTACPAG